MVLSVLLMPGLASRMMLWSLLPYLPSSADRRGGCNQGLLNPGGVLQNIICPELWYTTKQHKEGSVHLSSNSSNVPDALVRYGTIAEPKMYRQKLRALKGPRHYRDLSVMNASHSSIQWLENYMMIERLIKEGFPSRSEYSHFDLPFCSVFHYQTTSLLGQPFFIETHHAVRQTFMHLYTSYTLHSRVRLSTEMYTSCALVPSSGNQPTYCSAPFLQPRCCPRLNERAFPLTPHVRSPSVLQMSTICKDHATQKQHTMLG